MNNPYGHYHRHPAHAEALARALQAVGLATEEEQ